MKQKVDVIIPAKNRVGLLRQTLKSVWSQTSSNDLNLNIILVDDASDAPLSQQIQNRKGLTIIENKNELHGPGPSRSLGLSKSKSKYVSFIDSDDLWYKNFLRESINTLEEKDLAGSLVLTKPFFEEKYPVIEKIRSTSLNLIRNSFLLYFYFFNGKKLSKNAFFLTHISSMVFNKNNIKGVVFNETSKASEDWEFVADVLKKGEIGIIPKYLSYFRYSSKSNTNKTTVKPSRPLDYRKLLKGLPLSFKKGITYNLFLLYINLLEIEKYLKKMKSRAFYLFEYTTKIPKFTSWTMVPLGFLLTGRDFLVRIKKYNLNFVVNHYIDLMTLMETYLDDQYAMDLKKGPVIIDIGANIGDFTIKAALDKNATVYAYEPVKNTFRLLKANIALNNINNIHAFDYGIAEKEGKDLIYVSSASGLSSAFKKEDGLKYEEIRLKTLESVFKENKIVRCDLLKVDCEGGEYQIFRNLPKDIFTKTKNIIVEFHEGLTNGTRQELVSIFELNGYSVKVKKHPIENNIGLIFASHV